MTESREFQQSLYGPCQIEVPYKGVLKILFDEVLTPFYLFQVYFNEHKLQKIDRKCDFMDV